MDHPTPAADISTSRLAAEDYRRNFDNVFAPLTPHQALIESDRCYFCSDAPCVEACPTGIDIPSFIRKIATGNLKGSAHEILQENIMGAMCARACPTEVLCEGACVRNHGEHKPVAIGALQRHAVDWLFERDIQLFERAPATGKQVAVVGGGPAGLACAHRLAMFGHRVTVFERHDKLGGLNEYGIAAYKVPDDIAQREVRYLMGIGGIEARFGQALGRDFTLESLRHDHDAVFIALGLAGVNALGLGDEDLDGVQDAIGYIAALRQAADLSQLPVARRVVVIGGGMTAIDIATQSKRLGADEVTIVYRRGAEHMGASEAEQQWAQTNGVTIRHWARPVRLQQHDGRMTAVEFESTRLDEQGRLAGTGKRFLLAADMAFKAIGQTYLAEAIAGNGSSSAAPAMREGRIAVDESGRTSLPDVWAGGDCVAAGEDLTVVAVQHGKVAALAIDRFLRS